MVFQRKPLVGDFHKRTPEQFTEHSRSTSLLLQECSERVIPIMQTRLHLTEGTQCVLLQEADSVTPSPGLLQLQCANEQCG